MTSNILCDPNDLSEYDENNMRYALHQQGNIQPDVKILFTAEVFKKISSIVTDLLQGVHPEGNPIVVSNRVIGHMLSTVYSQERTNTSHGRNIYSKYIIPSNLTNYNVLSTIIDKTINSLTEYIKNEYEMIETNKKLNVWDSVLGDSNRHGLRAHPPIKTRERRVGPMMFNMNY